MTTFVQLGLLTAALLGQDASQERWEGVQNAFRNSLDRGQGEYSALVTAGYFIAGLFAVSLIAYLLVRRTQRSEGERTARPPLRFFGTLLAQLGVSWPDRFLLRLVARNAGLPNPSVMLLSPDILERHAGEWVDGLGVPFVRSYLRNRLDQLRLKAFS